MILLNDKSYITVKTLKEYLYLIFIDMVCKMNKFLKINTRGLPIKVKIF